MKAEILLNGAEKLNVSNGVYKFGVKNALRVNKSDKVFYR